MNFLRARLFPTPIEFTLRTQHFHLTNQSRKIGWKGRSFSGRREEHGNERSSKGGRLDGRIFEDEKELLTGKESLYSLACRILRLANAKEKAEWSLRTRDWWMSRKLPLSLKMNRLQVDNRKEPANQRHLLTEDAVDREEVVPNSPARPDKPVCVAPKDILSHKAAGVTLPVYLLHGLAHIELNAIDMVWDMLARFKRPDLPLEWYDDWVSVAADEARHFVALSERLEALGSSYGALLAHDSLWKNAERTTNNLKARIAVMQLVQEARALDAHPRLLQKVGSRGDKVSMKLVDTICTEEVDHVKKGVKWFEYLCSEEKLDPVTAFHDISKKYVDIKFFPPFNIDARKQAGMHENYYTPLAAVSSIKDP